MILYSTFGEQCQMEEVDDYNNYHIAFRFDRESNVDCIVKETSDPIVQIWKILETTYM